MQKYADLKLLSSKRPHDAERIFRGLRKRGNKKLGMELIDRELEKITNPKVKQTAYEHIHDISEGKRDFRF